MIVVIVEGPIFPLNFTNALVKVEFKMVMKQGLVIESIHVNGVQIHHQFDIHLFSQIVIQLNVRKRNIFLKCLFLIKK